MNIHEETLKIARNLIEKDPSLTDWVISKFPELKESKDEKIRNQIINFIEEYGNPIHCEWQKDWIAWLEKQGEQKPITIDIDKMVSKYSHTKDGDFGFPVNCQIRAYRQGINDALNLSLGIKKQGEQKLLNNDKYQTVSVEILDRLYESEKELEQLKQREQKPANNILEAWKDMRLEVYQQASGNRHESNYSDDATKMFSLNDIDEIIEKMSEQKPADKVEDEEYNGEDYGIDSLYHAQRILENTLGKVDGYQTDDGILEHQCAISAVKKLYEQKPTEEYNITGIGSKNAQGKLGEMIKNLKPVNEVLEQKPADKVEPKFHKGEWVVWQDKCYKVNYNGCGYELIDQNGLSTSLVYGTIEENAHLWTIKDAKDGDVLCSCQIIVLFKKWEDNTDYNFMIAYAGIDVSNKLQITNKHWLLSNDCKPATKEQRDLLFQKMREAGYEWDAEKLELKKVEQKPTEWSEEDERMYKSIIYSFDHNYPLLIQQQEFIKSLIFQKQWKPTKAQLTSLTIACDRNDRVGFDLTQLLKELKKL